MTSKSTLLSALGLLALVRPPAPPQGASPGDAPPLRHLVVFERGPGRPASPDAAVQRALDAHRGAMQKLFAEGRVLLGGPAPDLSCGVAVFDVADTAELERLLGADPAVAAGVFTPRIQPFLCSSARDLAPRPAPAAAEGGLAPVRHEAVVAAPLSDVWRAWSTAEGAETFFAPKVRLELAPHGKLDVLWFPDAPPGERGAEDLRVLAYSPERMLAFEWSAPPQFARARPERTFVVVELEPLAAQRTRVVLLHQGFAEQARKAPESAEEWKAVRAYFDGAWPTVLGALERRFASGPRDWGAAAAAAGAPVREGQ